jgi:hypothetical protein
MPVLNGSLVASESVVAAELDDEMVLLNVETGIYFGLDELGARIWRLLAAGADIDEMLDELLAEYDVAPEVLHADLVQFFDLLVQKGLARAQSG